MDKFSPRYFILYDESVNGIVFLIPLCNSLLLVYQNNQFFVLILHLSTLLNFLISSNSVLVESLVSSLYNIRSSAKRDFVFFPFCFDAFIYFSCLIPLARTSSTMMNIRGVSINYCLIPNLRRKAFTFSILTIMLAVGLLYMAFIMLR